LAGIFSFLLELSARRLRRYGRPIRWPGLGAFGPTGSRPQNGRDRIEVGRREGTFREIRVAVRGAPVEIYNVVVTFSDGNSFSPNLRQRFDENASSREIDLPGDRRVIRSVDFAYRSLNRREGRATVMLYGR